MQKVQETYDDISREFSESRSYAGKEFDLLKKILGPDQKILDLGCGNGRLLLFLEQEAKQWAKQTINYLGIDNSKKLLEEARKKHPGHHFQYGEMSDIPANDHSINTILCIRAFHHLPTKAERMKALEEMKRVLTPDGTLVVSVWNLWQKKYWIQLLKAIFRSILTLGRYSPKDTFIPWGKEKKPRYYHAFTARELRKLFEKSGWKISELTAEKNKTHSHDLIVIAKP